MSITVKLKILGEPKGQSKEDRLNGINQKGELNLFDLDYEERKD